MLSETVTSFRLLSPLVPFSFFLYIPDQYQSEIISFVLVYIGKLYLNINNLASNNVIKTIKINPVYSKLSIVKKNMNEIINKEK